MQKIYKDTYQNRKLGRVGQPYKSNQTGGGRFYPGKKKELEDRIKRLRVKHNA
jgi:hypothetical protein